MVLALILAAHVAIPTAPAYAYGQDPYCAAQCYSSSGQRNPLSDEEALSIATAAWELMHGKVLRGELTDNGCSECVRIRWSDVPPVSQCDSGFFVSMAAGHPGGTCAAGTSHISYGTDFWRVIVSADGPVEQTRALVVWETTNLALRLLGHADLADGPICTEIVKKVLN